MSVAVQHTIMHLHEKIIFFLLSANHSPALGRDTDVSTASFSSSNTGKMRLCWHNIVPLVQDEFIDCQYAWNSCLLSTESGKIQLGLSNLAEILSVVSTLQDYEVKL